MLRFAHLFVSILLFSSASAWSETRSELEHAAQGLNVSPTAPISKQATAPVAILEEPGLFFRGQKVTADRWKEHKDALDALTERFLSEVRPPFKLPAGFQIVSGQDDLAYIFERGGKLTVDLTLQERRDLNASFIVRWPHEAIDVGSRISADGGKSLSTLGNSPVYPVHPGGKIELRHGGAYIAQRVKLKEGSYQLILDIIYAHVAPAGGTFGPDKPVGTLDGDNHWDAVDPQLSRILPYKGNHLHLLIRGINDLEKRHYAELSRPGARNPDLLEYVQYRADFFNKRLLPKVAAGR